MLTVDDVDLDLGILKISDSKNHNDRLVPLSKTMLIRLQRYSEQVHSSGSHEFFFPGYKEKPMTLGNVYKNFRRFLWKAGISHTGDGPRVHDFRHTYCVFKLREWAEQGKDLMVLIPLMRTYLGHQTFNETAYYLKWTADVFPDIRLKLERYCEGIIPEMEEFQ
ncbi:tyrosine-type recombinase/integrase [Ruminococcus sp. HUN007]|nr:tyrosine-type recombinase/integrase [Ruminococcus sp. HUN007]